MKVIAFNGSPKAEGNTFTLLSTVLAEVEKEGIDTELIHIGNKPLAGCMACGMCAKNKDGRCAVESDDMNEYIEKMREADGILLGSPTYFGDMTTSLKALIERAGFVTRVNGFMLARKPGAAVVAVRRAGSITTINSISHFFYLSQMLMVGSSYWPFAIGRAPGDVLSDQEGMQTMKDLGRNMAWLVKKLGAEV